MADAVPLVDLASLVAGGGDPGARWRLDGEDLQANLVRLDQGDRIQPHRNDEVEVLVVVVLGRGELTLDGQVHQLPPMTLAHLPKGTVRAIEAVDGPLAYLSVHRRRSGGCRWVGTPSDAEVPRGEPPGRSARADPILELDGARGTIQLRETPGNLSGSGSETHQDFSPADANCCQSLLLDPDATIGIDLRKRLFLLVSGRGE
jgi:Cupin domain